MILGQNCGSCKRGAESMTHPTCKKCWDTEIDTKEKFTEWEGKESD